MPTTVDFKQIGGLVRITVAGDALTPNVTRTKNRASAICDFRVQGAGMFISVDDLEAQVQAIGDITFDGVAAASLADFYTKIALVFPNVGGGTTTPGSSSFEVLTDPAFYDLAPGKLLKWAILLPSANATLSMGSTAAGVDYMPATAVEAIHGEVVMLNIFSKTTTRRVYFNNLPAGSQVAISTEVITV